MKGAPYEYLEYSAPVQTQKCLLHQVLLTPNGTDISFVDVHDGPTAASPTVCRLRVGKGVSRPFLFNPPLQLQHGLYISVGADMESVLVSVAPQDV